MAVLSAEDLETARAMYSALGPKAKSRMIARLLYGRDRLSEVDVASRLELSVEEVRAAVICTKTTRIAAASSKPLTGRWWISRRTASAKLTTADVMEAKIFRARHPELEPVEVVKALERLRPWPVKSDTLLHLIRGDSFLHIQPLPWQIQLPTSAPRNPYNFIKLLLILCLFLGPGSRTVWQQVYAAVGCVRSEEED